MLTWILLFIISLELYKENNNKTLHQTHTDYQVEKKGRGSSKILPSMFTIYAGKQSWHTTSRNNRGRWSIVPTRYLYFLLSWLGAWGVGPWCRWTMWPWRWWCRWHHWVVEQSTDKLIKTDLAISISIQLSEQVFQLLNK